MDRYFVNLPDCCLQRIRIPRTKKRKTLVNIKRKVGKKAGIKRFPEHITETSVFRLGARLPSSRKMVKTMTPEYKRLREH